jgi:hypothetical protein
MHKSYHDVVCCLINNAEINRKMGLWHIRKLVGKILPRPLVNRLKDRFNQSYLKTKTKRIVNIKLI